MRTLPIFALLLYGTYAWSGYLYYSAFDQVSGPTIQYWQALEASLESTFGINTSAWMSVQYSWSQKLVMVFWLLLANICCLNIMIAISREVYCEVKDKWIAEDLNIRNEFILQAEKLYFWRREEKEKTEKLHLVFVEEDKEQLNQEGFESYEEKIGDANEKLEYLKQ